MASKSIAVMQPYFFPYLGYWQLVKAVDIFVVFDNVNYIKRGFVNRNKILINGKPTQLTLPLEQASQNKLINEITLEKKREKLLKSIELAYKKTPSFALVFPVIQEIMLFETSNLAVFNTHLIEKIVGYLEIDTDIVVSSELTDFAQMNTGQDKILSLVKTLNADIYINPPNGRHLYNEADFQKQGIELGFLQPILPVYQQSSDEFHNSLSIIDVLMHCSKSEVQNMLQNYSIQA